MTVIPAPMPGTNSEGLSGQGALPFDETIRFLRAMRHDGRCVLSAICPNDRGIETRTFDLARPDRLRAWLSKWNGERNLYWTPNSVKADADPNWRPSEADIEDKVAAFVDIDPSDTVDPADEEEWQADRARILKSLLDFRPHPSAIVDSGNGYQAFWLLDQPLYVGGTDEGVRQGKGYNVALAEKLGGDDCESLEHLYRLPGTINTPSDKKRAKGRIDRTATVVRWPSKERCGLGELDWVDPGEKAGKGEIEEIELGQIEFFDSLDDLPGGISARIRKVIELGPAADTQSYPSRNEAVMAVCCAGVRAGWTNEEIAAAILDPKWRISERLRQRGGKRDAALEIAKARALVGRVRKLIVYDEDELPRVLEETEAALVAGDVPIYQMAGRLVRDVRLGKASNEDGIRRAAGALVISDVSDYFLRERMIASARFVVPKEKDGQTILAKKAPPLSLAKHYAARTGMWNLPELVGVCEAPTLRADGSVVWQEGYDPASGLIIDTQGTAFPPVPDLPTKEDAKAALDVLLDLIAEFPFEPDEPGAPLGLGSPSASRSVALSMILTGIVRRALRTAPLHGISAPTMATGKSLLADVAAMIATGRPAPVISQASKEEEDEKRLFASLSQGDPILAIDNIDLPLSGDAYCSVLTSEVWQSRKLGESKNYHVSTKTLIIANGNNLELRGDMATRAVVARLDARCDDPGQRSAFRYDLKAHVPRERPKLVAAALTVLRGYIAAGYPMEAGVKPFARFEDWSRLIRGALLWLDQSDPVKTREKIVTNDAVGAALAGLHDAWHAGFGSDWQRPSDVIEAADDEERRLGRPGPLCLALSAFCPNPRGVNAISLGRKLLKFANRRVGGRWIEVDPNDKTGNSYRLMTEERQREAQQANAQGGLLRGDRGE